MHNRTLVLILQQLTPRQRKNFQEYLSCKYFNSNPLLLKVTKALDKWVSGSRRKSLAFEALQIKLNIAASTLEKSLSQILSLLRAFLAEEARHQSGTLSYGGMLEVMFHQGLEDSILESEFRYAQRKLNALPASRFQCYENLSLNTTRTILGSNKPRQGKDQPFHELSLSLEQFYLLSKCQLACAAWNAWRIFGGDQPNVLSFNNSTVADLGGEVTDLTQAYQKAIGLLQNDLPPLNSLEDLLHFLNLKDSHFSEIDRKDLHSYLLNACFRGAEVGKSGHTQLIYQVYQTMLQKKLLLDAGTINGSHFKNIVTITLRMGLPEEAAAFVESHRVYLPVKEAESLVPYTLGTIAFNTQQWNKAKSHYLAVLAADTEDLFWGLEARTMLLKCYFQSYHLLGMDELDDLHRQSEAFRIAISRKKNLSSFHKDCYANFVRLFSRLIKHMTKPDGPAKTSQLQNLIQEAESTREITNKQWLIQAITSKTD